MLFSENTGVRHAYFGRGSVIVDRGDSIVVRFEHGIQECLPGDLGPIDDLTVRAERRRFDSAVNVVARVLANCIVSVNDSWGVFSRSRIELLPHQLWVCKRVLESWPTRWLVADDVGLGKTIEAGLVLTPLLSSGRVRRLLIVAPASLVEQWQTRLREMFDIRVSRYAPAADTPTSDFWDTHDYVIASAHTLRIDTRSRWKRLMDANPWDLVMVDEAHHMNVEERGGKTLAFQLVEQLQTHGRIRSLVLFTGTPHRGKDYGFLSLLKLLRPSDFDPRKPLEEQIGKLRDVMIRNNKQRVTDMQGNPVFTPVRSRRETYTYSPAETRFYDQLTQFIVTGKAYAARLRPQQRRKATLVLITMQKLASSSIAAVRRALAKRLARLRNAEVQMEDTERYAARIEELEAEDDPANLDELARLEERLADNLEAFINLNPDEIPVLQKLLGAADMVERETKIERIMRVVDHSFDGRSVLFFTEYKATQALLMSALQDRYGDRCVTFINGDGFVDGVRDASGSAYRLTEDRRRAAGRFNRGIVRFLVSTEAAGEGIDLQENCCSLIHVDLPWNPMRLHQRVGRLSRYGQTQPVDVVSVRNPDTVESKIWECLDRKLDRITLAFQGGMEDPEDMRQLLIGMSSPRMYSKVFADASSHDDQRLEQWFDAQTARFGGEDAVRMVRSLFGNVARFDFGDVAGQIPRVDLPDLIPFVKSIFVVLGRRLNQTEDTRLSFRTPPEWREADFAIAEQYELLFAREPYPRDGEDIAGVGLRVMDQALRTATEATDGLAALGGLTGPLVVFALRDRITGSGGAVRKVVVGVQRNDDAAWRLLRDWEVLRLLNPAADSPRSAPFQAKPTKELDVSEVLADAEQSLKLRLDELELPFRLPAIEQLACLIPGTGVR